MRSRKHSSIEYFSTAGTSSPKTCIYPVAHVGIELEVAADDGNAVLLDEVFRLERRLGHLDAERLRRIAARDDAAIVRRQDDGGAAFERGTEDPFAGDEEVIAVGQSVDAHGRLRITPATTPQTGTSSPSIAAKGRAGQLALDCRDDDGTRTRGARAVDDQGVAGKDPVFGNAAALDRDKERRRRTLYEMIVEAKDSSWG